MESNKTQLGPAWTFYSDIWLGRAICKDASTGHVRTMPHRDPSQAMHEVCTVLWDDAPWQPEDIPVSTLRSYLMPMFVKDSVLVPPKVLQLQSNNWNLQNTVVFATAANAGQVLPNTTTYHTADEGSMQHSYSSGNGRRRRALGGNVASNFSTPIEEPASLTDTRQDIASNEKEAVCNHLHATVCKPACEATQMQPDSFNVASLPAAWLRRLIQEHLEPSDRLCLFQTNKAIAAVVMHHAIRPTLSLTQKTTGRVGHFKSVPRVRQFLVSLANNNLHVHVDEGAFRQSSSWLRFGLLQKQFVTQLTLSNMVLKVTHLMQLAAISNLSILAFGPDVKFKPATDSDIAQLSDLDSWLPTSCRKVQLSWDGLQLCVQQLVPVLASRITHLVIRMKESSRNYDVLKKQILDQLPHFTALTHIAIPCFVLDTEPLFLALVSNPTLTHVDIGSLYDQVMKYPDGPNSPAVSSQKIHDVQWKQLVIRGYCCLGGLMQFSLDHIQHVVLACSMDTKMRASVMTEQHIARLAACKKLQLMPVRVMTYTGYKCPKEAGERVPEQLCLSLADVEGSYTPEFVQACARSLEGGLCLPYIGLASLTDFVRYLPPTVNAVLLNNSTCDIDREHGCEQLVAALPVTVKKLVMESPSDGRELCKNAALIAKYLSTTRHPAVLYVLLWSHQEVLPELQQAVVAYNSRLRVIIHELNDRRSEEYVKPKPGFHDIWKD